MPRSRAHGAKVWPSWQLGVLGLVVGCTRDAGRLRFEPATGRVAIEQTVPASGALGVATTTRIDVCFDGRLAPTAVDRFSPTLSSGIVGYDIETRLQLFPWHEPGGGAAAGGAPWCPGSVLSVAPLSELAPGILYRMRLRAGAGGWAGESLDTSTPGWTLEDDGSEVFYLEFTTEDAGAGTDGASASGTGTGATDSTGGTTSDTGGSEGAQSPTLHELFAEGRVLDPLIGHCDCHTDPEALARERLDLSGPDIAFRGLVTEPLPGADGWPLVAPRRPSESWLIHKLLRIPDGTTLHGVRGDPMPPDASLAYTDLVDLALWIEGGAQP